ncbi:hypothetical protein [Chamaesiphon sp. VAR_48_metabat_403]|uniref:hypothetical protein n=1 Tax=Chamaesiphon sp. VAR_48_metabat_403 TaxID=2964700 RepID=UPI00286E41DC|nr:hypothetical protein [Chamaesiphon sp. VAR_48_metabat_403]
MKNSTTQMHKIVLGLAGVMSLFVITIPLAMLRVSATQKFAGQPYKIANLRGSYPDRKKSVVVDRMRSDECRPIAGLQALIYS